MRYILFALAIMFACSSNLFSMREYHDDEFIHEEVVSNKDTNSFLIEVKKFINSISTDQREVFDTSCLQKVNAIEEKYTISESMLFDLKQKRKNNVPLSNYSFCFFSNKNNLLELLKKIKESPLLLLCECTEQLCGMRRDNSLYRGISFRDIAEQYIVNELLKVIIANSGTLSAVSFGAGGLYSDAVVLEKILSIYPMARINYCIIDPIYTSYLQKIYQETRVDYLEHDEDIIEKSSMCQEELITLLRIQSFLRYLFYHYPRADLQLRVFTDSEQYKDYIAQNQSRKPDFLYGIDLNAYKNQHMILKDYFGLYEYVQEYYSKVTAFACYHTATKCGQGVVDQYAVHLDGNKNPFFYVPQIDKESIMFKNLLLRVGFYKKKHMFCCECILL